MTQMTLINCDYSQSELRAMAILSDDTWMKAALQEDQGDFFDSHMLPVAYPGIVTTYGSIAQYKQEAPTLHKEDRTNCKGIVYGLSFDRGSAAIAKALGMRMLEAQLIIDNFLGAAPQFAQWRVDVREAAINPAKRDMLINVFGRRFQSEIITSANYKKVQREALAFLPQSTSSDLLLSTAVRIGPTLAANGYHIFNLVHDAIMVEGPSDGAEQIGAYVSAEMRETGRMVFGDEVPFLSEWGIGDSWGDLS